MFGFLIFFCGVEGWGKAFISREKIGQIINCIPGGWVIWLAWTLRRAFFILSLSSSISASLIMPDFCLLLWVHRLRVFTAVRGFGYSIVIAPKKQSHYCAELGTQNNEHFSKRKKSGRFLFISQTSLWPFQEMESTQVTGIQEEKKTFLRSR